MSVISESEKLLEIGISKQDPTIIKKSLEGLKKSKNIPKVIRGLSALTVFDRKNALEYLNEGLLWDSNDSSILNNLGYIMHYDYNELEKAIGFYEKALVSDPKLQESYIGIINICEILQKDNKYFEKKKYDITDKALIKLPKSSELMNFKALNEIEKYDKPYTEILKIFEKAISCTVNADLHGKCRIKTNMGYFYEALGLIDLARESYLEALSYKQDDYKARSNLMFSLNYFKGFNNILKKSMSGSIFKDFKVLDQGLDKDLIRDPNEDQINIGYVSSDFSGHAVSFFTDVLFKNRSKKFKTFAYSGSAYIHDKIKEIGSDEYRYIRDLPIENFYRQIVEDNIHVLIDLSGFSSGNRLDIFKYLEKTKKILMFSFIGYPSDISIIPRLSDNYTEKFTEHESKFVLDKLFLCYKPLINVSLDSVNNSTDATTYGSFAKLSKINKDVIRVWSEILRRKPNSKLILKSKYFICATFRNKYLENFPEEVRYQIVLLKATFTQKEHLELYNILDVTLDTWPYSGTTITCESLYMGIPVITLNSFDMTEHVSRVSGSILDHCNLRDLITKTEEDYINLVLNFKRSDPNIIRKKFLDSMDPVKYMKMYEDKIVEILDSLGNK
jgi:predicted O-linked N-acetylglucosamine transferase (SPINDLY family)